VNTEPVEWEQKSLEVVVEARFDLVAPISNLTLKKVFEFAVG